MVYFGREGGRSRWKWDTAIRRDLQPGAGHLLRAFNFPATDRIELFKTYPTGKPLEFGGALILPEPDAFK